MFGVNFNKLINWLLPVQWRENRHIAWLRALIAPIKSLHTQLLTFIATIAFQMRTTGQVTKLRFALNEKYDTVARRIIIRDTAPVAQLYIYLEVENKPVYMPFFINGGGSDFEVLIPTELKATDIYFRSLLNKYKLPGKRYTIIYV